MHDYKSTVKIFKGFLAIILVPQNFLRLNNFNVKDYEERITAKYCGISFLFIVTIISIYRLIHFDNHKKYI